MPDQSFNPFGVGHAGPDVVLQRATCGCCGWPFEYERVRSEPPDGRRCAGCSSHAFVQGESVERHLDRLRDHDLRSHAIAERASSMVRDANRLAEARRDQTRAALSSRDRYERALLAVVEKHVPGVERCSCGERDCSTLRAIDDASPDLVVRLRRDIEAAEQIASDETGLLDV